MIQVGSFSKKDNILQVARCSFDIHVKDVIGTLVIGATLVMLHPDGILDLEYLAEILEEQEITYMQVVPSLLQSLFSFLKAENLAFTAKRLQSVCSSGE
jgi:non-ribosomal peptide synthetase component F